MATYPATERGAVCQYPVEKELAWRMVESESGGGVRGRRTASGRIVVWRLRYEELTDAEGAAFEQFYTECGGGLKPFTFADPLANALLDSEDPAGAAWQGSGAGMTAAGTIWDGHDVFLLAPGAALEQSVEIAGGMPYCASAWVRSEAGGPFRVDLGGNAVSPPAQRLWRKCWSTMAPAGTDGVVTVRFENLSGAAMEIAGLCVQAQAYPGESRASSGGRSLYREARFGEGEFKLIPVGPNRNTVEVTVEAAIEDEP